MREQLVAARAVLSRMEADASAAKAEHASALATARTERDAAATKATQEETRAADALRRADCADEAVAALRGERDDLVKERDAAIAASEDMHASLLAARNMADKAGGLQEALSEMTDKMVRTTLRLCEAIGCGVLRGCTAADTYVHRTMRRMRPPPQRLRRRQPPSA